ncbi:MAG: LytR C-terminal domain-containing protein [Actinomycetales bacterium]|nr:LytR C-terminal domain-containing protein [Actinomycetales bacterium]
MSTNVSTDAAQARAGRRRHLQQRQTVIFGGLIAAILVIGLTATAMWVGILPSPINVPISSPTPTDTVAAMPCPPDGQLPVPYAEISANVLNGTNTAGLAATTAASLAGYGVSIGQQANANARYAGVARIVAGPLGVGAAYTVAALFPEATIETDARSDATVDVIVGSEFEALLPAESITLDPTVDIPAPEGCTPVALPTEG